MGRYSRVANACPARGVSAFRSVAAPLLVAVTLCQCQSTEESVPLPGQRPKGSASAPPVDRLAPGELGASSKAVFGFAVPRGLKVDATFPDAVHLSGNVSQDAVAKYVRSRVLVSYVEVTGSRTVFPKARIKGGSPKRTYRFEVLRERGKTLLVIRDTTAPPLVRGISEAERWRRAGMTPEGKPLDPQALE
jgi:hypothetical protein